ncbi:MAG: DNA repair protein RecO [Clostridiales bacterium]|nr:DNA repair protein RecO [Clostridiales bacterium]
MASHKIRGLVLSAKPHKEQDRLIRILTSNEGVIFACTPGAGKIGSRHGISAQPGALSDFSLNCSKGFYYVSESELVEPFRGLYEDIERLTAAAHILEITSDVCVSADISSLVYPYVIRSLFALSEKIKPLGIAVSAFEWKLMDLSGYSADLAPCACGKSRNDSQFAFSFSKCRVFCIRPACLRDAGEYKIISVGALEALRYIQRSNSVNYLSFTVSDTILSEMGDLTRRYLCERFEKKYCKMDLLNGYEALLGTNLKA